MVWKLKRTTWKTSFTELNSQIGGSIGVCKFKLILFLPFNTYYLF
jgi:hypothetical protein